jgi:signal transduction histidine kinase
MIHKAIRARRFSGPPDAPLPPTRRRAGICYNGLPRAPARRRHHVHDHATDIMTLATFILANLDRIIAERDALADAALGAPENMTSRTLREHAKEILRSIAKDMEACADGEECAGEATAAAIAGALRLLVAFDLPQLGEECRMLKSGVLRLWTAQVAQTPIGMRHLADMMRFSEAMDQALSEALRLYSDEVGRALDTFFGILGHDLRTPLGAISMAADYLGVPGIAEEKRAQAVGRIRSSTATMNAMIRDLLEYTKTRLQHGIPIAPRPADMGRICEGALDAVRTAHPYCAVDFRASGDLAGSFDAARLQQAIINLLNNAVQYRTRGTTIVFTARDDGDAVCVQVKNHGARVPGEVLQIFLDPAIQVSAGMRSTTSLGLGLFIAREIVVTHGGTIRVASNEANETVFTVVLPKAVVPATAPADA